MLVLSKITVFLCASIGVHFLFSTNSSWWWSRWSAWAKRGQSDARRSVVSNSWFCAWCHATRPSYYNFYYVFRQEHAKSTSSHWKSVFDTQFTLEKFHVFCVPLSPAGVESWFNLTPEDRLQCRACQLSRFWIQIDQNQESPLTTMHQESRINQEGIKRRRESKKRQS